jgi:hypothetical protein
VRWRWFSYPRIFYLDLLILLRAVRAVINTSDQISRLNDTSNNSEVLTRSWFAAEAICGQTTSLEFLLVLDFIVSAHACLISLITRMWVQTSYPFLPQASLSYHWQYCTACPPLVSSFQIIPGDPVRLAGGWCLVLICSERKLLLADCWWLVCSDRIWLPIYYDYTKPRAGQISW